MKWSRHLCSPHSLYPPSFVWLAGFSHRMVSSANFNCSSFRFHFFFVFLLASVSRVKWRHWSQNKRNVHIETWEIIRDERSLRFFFLQRNHLLNNYSVTSTERELKEIQLDQSFVERLQFASQARRVRMKQNRKCWRQFSFEWINIVQLREEEEKNPAFAMLANNWHTGFIV